MAYRVYVCGPMTGYKDYNFPKFDAVANQLRQANTSWIIISPADMDKMFDGFSGHGKPPEGLDHKVAMGRDLPTVIQCDAIYLMHGWSKSKGAKAEVAAALACGLDILYEDGAEDIDGVTIV